MFLSYPESELGVSFSFGLRRRRVSFEARRDGNEEERNEVDSPYPTNRNPTGQVDDDVSERT